MLRLFLLAAGSLLISECYSQYNWKPEKDKNGIKVFLSDVPGSSFKAVKVECTLTGTYAKLISLLTNVSKFED